MKLEQGKEYELKLTGKFCHTQGGVEREDFPLKAVFVGEITLYSMQRNIFYVYEGNYTMFDAKNVDYIVKKPTQEQLADRAIDEASVVIATCGECGKVVLHDFDDIEVECPHCGYQSEQCDFPDLITD